MDIPDDPSKPCLSCTKLWCQRQNLHICTGASIGDANPDTATGKEGDIEARCFRALPRPCTSWLRSELTRGHVERDSPRDQLVVTLFLLTVFGLLLGAGIKGRMLKAGFDTSLPWSASRRWWEVCDLFPLLYYPACSVLKSCLSSRHGYLRGSPKISVLATRAAISLPGIAGESMFLSPTHPRMRDLG